MIRADLTGAEQSLWNAFGRGAWVDPDGTDAGAPSVIRAEIIAALLLGALPAEPGSAAGVRLRGAAITGRLDLTGGTVMWPLVCHDCRFDTELSFVDTSVRTVGILDSELPAFNGTRVRLDGILDLTGSRVAGSVRLGHAKVTGQLRMRGVRAGDGGEAVRATGLSVDGDIDCTRMDARGRVSFDAASVSGAFDLSEARISRPGQRALFLNYATIGGELECNRLTVEGETRAHNCRVAAQLGMTGARFDSTTGMAFFAGGLRLGGGAFFSRGFARGEFRLIGAQLGANLSIDGAIFENPDGTAVNLEQASLGSLNGDRLTCKGQLSLIGARVRGDVRLSGAALQIGDGTPAVDSPAVDSPAVDSPAVDTPALNAERAQIDGALVLRKARASSADLSDATIGVLRDDPDAWPDRLHLDGFSYETLDPLLPASQRLRWLARDPRGGPQPYERLAAHYTAIGRPGHARDVLYARERMQHQGRSPLARAWSTLQDITVGYGYRPRRALVWLALLLVIGSIVFSAAPPPPLQPGAAPHFNGIIYTLDLMLPVVNLGQKYAFNPSGAEQWLSYFFIAAGWILATTVATGAARVLRRG